MEVLHRPGLLCMPQPATFYPQNLQRMYTTSSDMYSCFSVHVNTPSRTPTPERHHIDYRTHFDTPGHTTTLHSVLRGEIPPAYSHLTTPSSLHPVPPPSSSHSTTPIRRHNYSTDVDSRHSVTSPCLSIHSSSSYSPRPSSHGSHTSQDSHPDPQTEPIDLSCRRLSRKRTAGSAFHDFPSPKRRSSTLSSSVSAKFSTSPLRSSEFPSPSLPTLPSSLTPPMHRLPPSPGESQNEEFSLLRNLLSVGKRNLPSPTSAGLSQNAQNLSDRTCDSPASDSFPRTPVTGNTKVQLAKKNLFPVSARVSDWLVKIVQFVRSIPEFAALSHNDKITLILNSWTRIMLLYMAESNFQFAVTPLPSANTPQGEQFPSKEEPTMKSVEGLQTFIKKCQQMAVDSKEYDFFRMLVLFNSGYPGLSCPEVIDQLSSVVQQLLQQHVRVSRPRDPMHHSRLLMCLPSLYSTNSRMFENLFCKHITSNTDMEVLLKELLQNIP